MVVLEGWAVSYEQSTPACVREDVTQSLGAGDGCLDAGIWLRGWGSGFGRVRVWVEGVRVRV